MYRYYKWIQAFALVLGFALLGRAIWWAEIKQATKTCQTIDLDIQHTGGHQFIQDAVLIAQLNESYPSTLIGKPLEQIASRKIENTVKSGNFVHGCRVYKNWNGCLKIKIFPKRPIARVIARDEPDRYIDEKGSLLPLAPNYTARVVLINGKNLYKTDSYIKDWQCSLAFLKLLTLIDQDPFWRAQIHHITCDEKGKLNFSTQLGQQVVMFGKPENIIEKMKKLKLFYKVILPYKGWNTYQRVNLEFDNQIVCE